MWWNKGVDIVGIEPTSGALAQCGLNPTEDLSGVETIISTRKRKTARRLGEYGDSSPRISF